MPRKNDDFYRTYSAIKRSFSKSSIHRKALENALCKKKGPRGGKRYKCAECIKCFPLKDVQVDHIDPVVAIGVLMKDMTWCDIYHRTYCDVSNLQVLCSECHKVKSKVENKERRLVKNAMSDIGCKPLLKNSLLPCGKGN